MPYFDRWGWVTDIEDPNRYTDTPLPENIPEGYKARWTWKEWLVLAYTPPEEPVAPVVPRKITKLAFRNRFTLNEKITIEMASLDNPAATMEQRALAASLRVYLDDVRTATFIDLNRQDTRNGVLALEAAGLLASGRALQILDAEITDIEQYEE